LLGNGLRKDGYVGTNTRTTLFELMNVVFTSQSSRSDVGKTNGGGNAMKKSSNNLSNAGHNFLLHDSSAKAGNKFKVVGDKSNKGNLHYGYCTTY
jgi:hypothetical protein